MVHVRVGRLYGKQGAAKLTDQSGGKRKLVLPLFLQANARLSVLLCLY